MPPPETFGRSFTMTPSTDNNFMNTPETKAGPLPFEQRPRETTKAYAAFKTYLDLGPTRSLVQAAAKLGCTKRRMEQLSRKNGWVARVDAFNQHFADLERQAKLTVTCQIAGCCPTASIRFRPSFRPQGRCYPAVRDTRFHSGPRSVSAHFSRENDNLYSQERLPLQYFIFSGSNLRF